MRRKDIVTYTTAGAELTLVGHNDREHIPYLRISLRSGYKPPIVQPDYLGTIEGPALRMLGKEISKRCARTKVKR